jgi:hypothetical protein
LRRPDSSRATGAVEGDPFVHSDAKVIQGRTAQLKRLK